MKQSIDSFFESIHGKRIALIGMGRSHMPLIPLFTKYGATVIACDKRNEEALGEAAEKAKADGAQAPPVCRFGATSSTPCVRKA